MYLQTKMKPFYLIFIFILGLGSLVTCETVLDAFYNLQNKVVQAKSDAITSISNTHAKVISDNEEIFKNIVPSLTEAYNDVMEYIKYLETQTNSLGYNFTNCKRWADNIFVNAPSLVITNVTTRVEKEKESIYDIILLNTYHIGIRRLQQISFEVTTLNDEYHACDGSAHPEYCSGGLYYKLVQKQEEIPFLLSKEGQITSAKLVQQGMLYRSRSQDYLEEAMKTIRPYIIYLDSCVQVLINNA